MPTQLATRTTVILAAICIILAGCREPPGPPGVGNRAGDEIHIYSVANGEETEVLIVPPGSSIALSPTTV
ncbi:MAG TPA: hypothetical protein VK969_10800, partial [Acidimicrobiia bacterium]|nr:hypothetical protein [Acidimicrobiia bacterium]